MTVRANDHIAAMAAYSVPKKPPADGRPLISLSQNESLRPPSPNAIKAAQQALSNSALYPDPNWTELREAIAELHNIPADQILCGNGSLDLIGALMRVYAGPANAVLAPEHVYPYFRSAAQMVNARFDTAAESNVTVCVDSLLHALQPDTHIVCVANPGNPTGTRIPKSELQRLRKALQPEILLIIDEAYGEFADHLDERCFDMVNAGNTVVLRTFSKAYCLAGMRAGWGLFPAEVAAEIFKVLNPNNVSRATQSASVAALADQAYMLETCSITTSLRKQAVTALQARGFQVFDSHTNFLLIDCGAISSAKSAESFLRSKRILLRGQAGAGLPQALRMTIATDEDLNTAIDYLCRWQSESRT